MALLTKDEFLLKYRGQFMVCLTDAWVCRHESPSALGLLMDRHAQDVKRLLSEVYEELTKVVKIETGRGPAGGQK